MRIHIPLVVREHSRIRLPSIPRLFGLAAVLLALSGCALQAPYRSADLSKAAPATWSADAVTAHPDGRHTSERWWLELQDSAIDRLVEAAFFDSPTLAQAVARIEEAQATLGANAAARMPSVGARANLTRAQSQTTSSQAPELTALSTSVAAGPSISWELDLFGRIRQSIDAAQSRLDARTADAASARLALAADVANGVLSLRACEISRRVFVEDIASREKTLVLTSLRLKVGFAAPVDEARALSGIATSRTNLAVQEERCARQVSALVALSGKDARTVRELVGVANRLPNATPVLIPQAPPAALELPATVLARHPNVISSEGEVAAAWAEIGVARANRLPRLDLAAVLTGQWIRAAGSTLDFATWSIGPSLTGTLFDGGAGAANVNAAEARYSLALARLQSTLRNTVQDVENALAAQISAKARVVSAGEGVAAARTTLQASEAQWKSGAISLFELEDSRRQFASAQDAEISARRDQAQAWIALVKATGGAITLPPESTVYE